jgi:hypothetical protein
VHVLILEVFVLTVVRDIAVLVCTLDTRGEVTKLLLPEVAKLFLKPVLAILGQPDTSC